MATTYSVYLNFPGTSEEAFNFYRSIFGGEFDSVNRYREMPGNEEIPEDVLDKIMHISLPISDGYTLMATDALETFGQHLKTGNNSYIMLNVDSKEEADRLFNGLSEGGNVEMEMQDSFWGSYFGSFSDKYDVHWMINYEYPQK